MTQKITLKKIVIKTMPDKETLEAFLVGMFGNAKVCFDANKGEFIWLERDIIQSREK